MKNSMWLMLVLVCTHTILSFGMQKDRRADEITLRAVLNNEIRIAQFYTEKSNDDLVSMLDLLKSTLNNKKVLDLFANEKKKTASEIKKFFQEALYNGQNALEDKVGTSRPAGKVAFIARSTLRKPLSDSSMAKDIAAQSGNYQLYILLGSPTLGDSSAWNAVIDSIESGVQQINQKGDVKFVPLTHDHITLARYRSPNQFSQEFIKKVQQALSRSADMFKIIYPKGIPGIALENKPFVLGKGTVSFKVVHSLDLQKAQEIIKTCLSYEQINDFELYTFQNKDRPLHISLGRIKPKSFAYNKEFKNLLAKTSAPTGTSSTHKESFSVNQLLLSSPAKNAQYVELATYNF